jgi:hypothetical protein
VAYPGPTCALVLALLFNSVDEIEIRLESAHHEVMTGSSLILDVSLKLALQEFIDGSSLEKVHLKHSIPPEEFESWLRSAAKHWQLNNISKEE